MLSCKNINPEMITLGRNIRKYSQKDLAEKINITQGKLSKIEAGLLKITESDINAISKALNFPCEFFSQNERIYGLGISIMYHRKKRALSIKDLKAIEGLAHLRHLQIKKLLEAVEIGSINYESYDLEDGYTPEDIADDVRALWNLPAGPIFNVVELIEDNGGIVVPLSLDNNKIDALSLWSSSNMPPLFFINISMPMDRIRFTLCHELGHIFMHRTPNDNMEKEADRFAAEFLMPQRDIKKQLKSLSLEKLEALKIQWKVSMAALVYRAKELETITQNQAQYLFKKLATHGYKTREPKYLEPKYEEPHMLSEILKLYYEELRYSKSELSKLLFINKDELSSLIVRPQILRLVK